MSGCHRQHSLHSSPVSSEQNFFCSLASLLLRAKTIFFRGRARGDERRSAAADGGLKGSDGGIEQGGKTAVKNTSRTVGCREGDDGYVQK